ncbi:MAG: RluA family pseudouridine synthase [Muricoprocola sp.]
MKKQIESYVTEEMNLERFLCRELGMTKRQIRQAKYRESGICVNGVRSRVTTGLKPGDLVSVLLEENNQESSQLVSRDGRLRILYEDEDILAVDKPSGVVVHPSHGHYEDSLSNMVVGYFREKGISAVIRPVGRLDKDTSGIVLFAKNQVAASRLIQQKVSGDFSKEYLALVQGHPVPEKNTICTDLIKDPDSLMKMKVTEKGLQAVTHYEVLEKFEGHSLVHVIIETGRTHQIRVHMASIGYPLLGDTLYGTDLSMKRTALHAVACHFLQPFTKEKISLEAEIPEDMKNLGIRCFK